MFGTAIWHNTCCADRRGCTMAGTTRAVLDSSTNHSSADRIVVNSYNHGPVSKGLPVNRSTAHKPTTTFIDEQVSKFVLWIEKLYPT